MALGTLHLPVAAGADYRQHARFHTDAKVMLPLVTPGLFATAVIVFLFSWNDFVVAVNLTTRATQTVPVSIATFSQQYEVRYGEMAAGSFR